MKRLDDFEDSVRWLEHACNKLTQSQATNSSRVHRYLVTAQTLLDRKNTNSYKYAESAVSLNKHENEISEKYP